MNWSAWARFRRQQAVEREQLRHLLARLEPLATECAVRTPSTIELLAVAAMLHSFYNGVKNIFKRLTVELDDEPVAGEAWHRALLRRMTEPRQSRPALLPIALHDTLSEYLRFRHVFRSAYTFDLDWRKLAPLAVRATPTGRELEDALDRFLAQGPSGEQPPD